MTKSRTTKKKANKPVVVKPKKARTSPRKADDHKGGAVEAKGFGLRLMDEIQNDGIVHYQVVSRIEAETQRNLVCYTSFLAHPLGAIDDPDARMIETLLQSINLGRYPETLDLMIHSAGGSPTAAEKIVLTCRKYAKSFRVIVPQMAMSAATMVAMGADSIVMTETSEIGPIDPQMIYAPPEGGAPIVRPAAAFVDAYLDLVNKMQQGIKKGDHPQPYIELLKKVDPTWIQVCLKARQLAAQIVEDFLTSFMLKDEDKDTIQAVIRRFLTEGEEYSHGRAIRADKARTFGLNVELVETGSSLWKALWELHARCERYVQSKTLAKYFVGSSGGINLQAGKISMS